MNTVALSVSTLGALCLALMLMFDRLMMSGCYKDNSDLAWLVSATGGLLLGMIATAITWIGFAITSEFAILDFFSLMFNNFYPQGIVLVIAGALNIQVLRHYLRLFVPDQGIEPNETAIAMWLATIPLFVLLGATCLGALQSFLLSTTFLDKTPTHAFSALVVCSVLAIIGFEIGTSGATAFRVQRLGDLLMMTIMAVAYTLLTSWVLNKPGVVGESPFASELALQPYYWLGFAAGLRPLFLRKTRMSLLETWPQIRKYLTAILVVETIGMCVYYFEYWGLTGLDAITVTLIISSHVLPVFIISTWLAYLRRSKEAQNDSQSTIFFLQVHVSNLPSERATASSLSWLALVLALLAATIVYGPNL